MTPFYGDDRDEMDDRHRLDPVRPEPELKDCELCGNFTERLTTVPDCDRTVGYHGSVDICDVCLETYKNHCGTCA